VTPSGGGPGLVHEANRSREEASFVACAFGPDGPQPPAGGKDLKEFVTRVGGVGHTVTRVGGVGHTVTRVGGVGHNVTCPPQGPRGQQVL